MLAFELIGRHEGLRILSHTDILREFHDILHDVNERSPLIADKEGVFLALAYDVRKAYEGQRIVRKSAKSDPYGVTRVGVDILWPTILVQCRMLRSALGFIDTTKRRQAFAYALEAIVEEGLQGDFPSDFRRIHELYQALPRIIPPSRPTALVALSTGPAGRQRNAKRVSPRSSQA